MKKILDSTEHIFKFEFDKISSFKVCPTGATTFGHTERDWSVDKQYQQWEVVVAQLVERSLPIPRFESSHQQKFINIEHLYTVNCVLKRQK